MLSIKRNTAASKNDLPKIIRQFCEAKFAHFERYFEKLFIKFKVWIEYC